MSLSTVLLDTHILIWILTGARQIKNLAWVAESGQWTLSPLSLLETKFLLEKGKVDVELASLLEDLKRDERFKIDTVSLDNLCQAALDLSWTRDPFDRLLVAHSIVRGIPLGTCDLNIRKNYSNVL